MASLSISSSRSSRPTPTLAFPSVQMMTFDPGCCPAIVVAIRRAGPSAVVPPSSSLIKQNKWIQCLKLLSYLIYGNYFIFSLLKLYTHQEIVLHLALTQISLYRYKQFLRDIFFNSFISQEIFYSRITKSFHMHFSCEKTLLEIHMNTQATHLIWIS